MHLIKAKKNKQRKSLEKTIFTPGYPLYYRFQFSNNPPSPDLISETSPTG